MSEERAGSGFVFTIDTWLDITVDRIPGRIFGSTRPSRPVQRLAFLHIDRYINCSAAWREFFLKISQNLYLYKGTFSSNFHNFFRGLATKCGLAV